MGIAQGFHLLYMTYSSFILLCSQGHATVGNIWWSSLPWSFWSTRAHLNLRPFGKWLACCGYTVFCVCTYWIYICLEGVHCVRLIWNGRTSCHVHSDVICHCSPLLVFLPREESMDSAHFCFVWVLEIKFWSVQYRIIYQLACHFWTKLGTICWIEFVTYSGVTF
jgi:hypothetical protein